jgi:hypothetical protein
MSGEWPADPTPEQLWGTADHLERAWNDVEAGLPEGWIIQSLTHDGMTWDATAGPYGSVTPTITGMGDTATAALRALAVSLAAER